MKRAFWIIIALLLISIGVNVWQCSHQPEIEMKIERDTVWRDSFIREPVPAETINTGRVMYVKIQATHSGQSPCAVDSLSHTGDSPHVSQDSIALPIVQKRYDDSLYTAWVSGYEPALDSIDLRLPTVTETVTKTIVKPSPRLSIGVQAGAGVGVFSRHPDIYIGVGAQWRFWPK